MVQKLKKILKGLVCKVSLVPLRPLISLSAGLLDLGAVVEGIQGLESGHLPTRAEVFPRFKQHNQIGVY